MSQMLNSKMNSNKLNIDDHVELQESFAWKHNQEQLTIYENKMRELLPIVKKLLNSEMERLKK